MSPVFVNARIMQTGGKKSIIERLMLNLFFLLIQAIGTLTCWFPGAWDAKRFGSLLFNLCARKTED